MQAPSAPVPAALEALARPLREAQDDRERNLLLAKLGAASPRCGASPPPGAARVPGCVSVVHIAASSGPEGRVRLEGSSDAALARGLLALVVDGLDGLSPAEMLAVDSAAIASAARLAGAVSPSRINGLDNILRTAQGLVAGMHAGQGVAKVAEGAEKPHKGPGEGLEAATVSVEAAAGAARLAGPALAGAPAQGERVALLISGGVDSSVALHLLKAAGHDVHAFYLRVWLADEMADLSDCPWEEDWAYASEVCARLGVPLEAVSVQEEYWDRVVAYLVDEARAGRTPNPDVMCNSRVKFGVFLDSIGQSYGRVASGHYARLRRGEGGRTELVRAVDRHKDQSYFLSSLSQAQLSRLEFPIGGLTKPEVRRLAEAEGLPTSARKDSQGVCFLGRLHFDEFLRHHLGERPGPIVEWETGERVGTHRGIWFHTVGQRKGLGPGLANAYAAKGPWHVVSKDPSGDVVFVSRRYWEIADERREMEVAGLRWASGAPPVAPGVEFRTEVQVRHGDSSHLATAELVRGGEAARVVLDEPDKGLAPGQFAAFYDGDVCLGAGVIGG